MIPGSILHRGRWTEDEGDGGCDAEEGQGAVGDGWQAGGGTGGSCQVAKADQRHGGKNHFLLSFDSYSLSKSMKVEI